MKGGVVWPKEETQQVTWEGRHGGPLPSLRAVHSNAPWLLWLLSTTSVLIYWPLVACVRIIYTCHSVPRAPRAGDPVCAKHQEQQHMGQKMPPLNKLKGLGQRYL